VLQQFPARQTSVKPARKQGVEDGHLGYRVRHTLVLHIPDPFPSKFPFFPKAHIQTVPGAGSPA
jgi:hypothetical protein